MEIECPVCKIKEQLSEEDLKFVSQYVKRRPEATDVDFLQAISFLRGPTCEEKEDHPFIFTEEFENIIDELTTKHAEARKLETKLINDQVGNTLKIKELQQQIQQLTINNQEIDQQHPEITDTIIMTENILEIQTQTKDFNMWS